MERHTNMSVTLEQIAADISRIESHLEKLNGRVGRVEERSMQNASKIEIQRNRCQLISEYSDKDMARIEKQAIANQDNLQKLRIFVKENSLQIAQLAALLGIITKLMNLW